MVAQGQEVGGTGPDLEAILRRWEWWLRKHETEGCCVMAQEQEVLQLEEVLDLDLVGDRMEVPCPLELFSIVYKSARDCACSIFRTPPESEVSEAPLTPTHHPSVINLNPPCMTQENKSIQHLRSSMSLYKTIPEKNITRSDQCVVINSMKSKDNIRSL